MEMPDKIYAAEYFDIDSVSLKEWREKSITGSEQYHHSRIVEDLKENLSKTGIALAARNSEIIELRRRIAELEAIIEARGM